MKSEGICYLCLVDFSREIQANELPVCCNCYNELSSLPPMDRMELCITLVRASNERQTAESLKRIIGRFEWLCEDADNSWRNKLTSEGLN